MPWKNPYEDTALDVLGVRTHRVNRRQLIECFESALDGRGPIHFAYLNVAVANRAWEEPEFAAVLNRAEMVYIDGEGIRWGARILGADTPPRNTGADFLVDVLEVCGRKGKRVGLLGGLPGSAAAVKERFEAEVPGLAIPHAFDGFEDLAKDDRVRVAFAEDPPDLLLLGLGAPRQERWIDRNRDSFGIGLIWTVGALFDYYSGAVDRCPPWMGRYGLEWMHRLYCEPRRLWKRYLIGNPLFLLRCLSSRWRGRGATP